MLCELASWTGFQTKVRETSGLGDKCGVLLLASGIILLLRPRNSSQDCLNAGFAFNFGSLKQFVKPNYSIFLEKEAHALHWQIYASLVETKLAEHY